MIIFKKIRFKNILSVGNKMIEIGLFENPNTLIVGSNGSGKSTFIDALFFVLYNKPFRSIKKDQLVNSINKKKLLVEVEFSDGTKKYKVIRGIKPNKFEIYINGELKDQPASSKEYQDFLELNILKMDKKTFRQVVVLGSTTYVPFMKLPLGDRRIVIDEILDVKIFAVMNNILKRYVSNHKTELNENSIRTNLLNEKLEENEKLFEEIDRKKKIDLIEYKNNVEELSSSLICLKEKSKELTEKISLEDWKLSGVEDFLHEKYRIFDTDKSNLQRNEKIKRDIILKETKRKREKEDKNYNKKKSDVVRVFEEGVEKTTEVFNSKHSSFLKEVNEIEKKVVDLRLTTVKANTKKDSYSKKMKFYEDHEMCEECGQDIVPSFREKEIKENGDGFKKYTKVVSLIEKEMEKLKKSHNKVMAEILQLEKTRSDEKDMFSNSHNKDVKTLQEKHDRISYDTEKYELEKLDSLNTILNEGIVKVTVEFNKKTKELKENKEILSDSITKNRSIHMGVTKTLAQHEVSIENFKTQISEIENQNKDNSLFELINKTKLDIEDCRYTKDELYDDAKNYEILKTMFKDSGIKAEILKNYIPIINALIRKYLEIMEFEIDFRFNENFEETIKSHHRNTFSYSNFSEGEKMRIDLCLLFTLREIARQKNSSMTNLLIFDEIGDSSLDEDGFSSFMKIIKNESKNQNVFIISHKQEMDDNFINVIRFRKGNLFSEMV